MERLALRQYGHVTRAQLVELGLAERRIDRWIEAGRLIRVHAGVYAVGLAREDAVARAAAAVLACGPGALLSHTSAAALWGLGPEWPRWPQVTLPSGDRRPPGIQVHRCSTLARADRRRQRLIWVTSVARTILDIAPGLGERRLRRIVNDALVADLLRPSTLAELLDRCPKHPGAKRLRPFADDDEPTKSELEDSFAEFVKRHGLPVPRTNFRVAGVERDIVYERERVIVELDGWRFHRSRASFEADRERDAVALAAGFVTVRLTWRRVHGVPAVEAARLREILAARVAGPG